MASAVSELWPFSARSPLPLTVTESCLEILSTDPVSRRSVRLVSRASRRVVDAHVLGLNVPSDQVDNLLAASDHYPTLHHLRITGHGDACIAAAARAAAALPRLAGLSLQRVGVCTPAALEGLADSLPALSALTCLEVDSLSPEPSSSGAALVAAAARLGGLRVLLLGPVALSAEATLALADAIFTRAWPDLETLQAQVIGAAITDALAASAPPKLEKLRLWGDDDFQVAAQPPYMQNLVTLELNSFRFGAAGLSRLRGKRMPRLRSLALSSCALGDADAAHLALLGLPSLRRLDLCYNELTDGAVSALAGAPWISALTRLKLSENEGVGDAGAAALAAAPLRGLRALRIGGEGTRLTDAGVAALAGAAWLTGLTELKLSACYDRADYLGSDRRAWAALAAAPLNALRVLGLKFVRLQPDTAAALGAAPWLHGLRSLTVERGSFLAIVEAAPHSCRGLLKRAGVTFSVAYNMALPVPSEDEGSSRPSDDAGDEGREALVDNEGSAAGDGFNCRSDGGGCGGGDDEGNGEAED